MGLWERPCLALEFLSSLSSFDLSPLPLPPLSPLLLADKRVRGKYHHHLDERIILMMDARGLVAILDWTISWSHMWELSSLRFLWETSYTPFRFQFKRIFLPVSIYYFKVSKKYISLVCFCVVPGVDLLFVQYILVQPVFIQSISSNPNLSKTNLT